MKLAEATMRHMERCKQINCDEDLTEVDEYTHLGSGRSRFTAGKSTEYAMGESIHGLLMTYQWLNRTCRRENQRAGWSERSWISNNAIDIPRPLGIGLAGGGDFLGGDI
jgi:hypothetical protein